ncbi:hypothetical protein [Kitasatospora atroaurantiaca]|uniref:hypothetical protein n=1 Tax=Kitasatospora atroaurantiaca TaxID=285545 RepID=UPI00119E07A1|nr:hypothetical protein [Kitasatospora atroaurantiaca]
MNENMHGAALIDQVVARVRQDGWPTADAPDIAEAVPLAPEVIDRLRLPGGRALPPSLRRWLAFDSSWLGDIGWYDDEREPVFDGRALGATAEWMYGPGDAMVGLFADFEKLLPGPCLPLVGGSDSRRLLYWASPTAPGSTRCWSPTSTTCRTSP